MYLSAWKDFKLVMFSSVHLKVLQYTIPIHFTQIFNIKTGKCFCYISLKWNTFFLKNQACFQKCQIAIIFSDRWTLLCIFSFPSVYIIKTKTKVKGLTAVKGSIFTITEHEGENGVSYTGKARDSRNALWIPDREF